LRIFQSHADCRQGSARQQSRDDRNGSNLENLSTSRTRPLHLNEPTETGKAGTSAAGHHRYQPYSERAVL